MASKFDKLLFIGVFLMAMGVVGVGIWLSQFGPWATALGAVGVALASTIAVYWLYRRHICRPIERLASHLSRSVTDPKDTAAQTDDHPLLSPIRDAVLALQASLASASREVRSIARLPEENRQPVMRCDRAGRVLFRNQVAASKRDLFGDREAEHVCGNIARAVSDANVDDVLIEMECDGRVCAVTIVPIEDMGYFNVYVRDLTDQRAAEAALRELTDSLEQKVATRTNELELARNDAARQLAATLSEIGHAASNVHDAVKDIAGGNDQLGGRTRDQRERLNATSARVREMTQAASSNLESSARANECAERARGEAEEGGQVVGRAVEAISEIHDASSHIADITGVIDDIAFQTNLLALNAAVEAARAGEQGKGFAVVASEVRALAQRSAAAAREIKQLITDTVQKAQRGHELANQSGELLRRIIDSVEEVSGMTQEISVASRDQTDAIGDINGAIEKMEHMTLENGALVEQVASRTDALELEASALRGLISSYERGEQPHQSLRAVS
ncbi:MAG: methyl-accepting chemotaxis protein [Pseudomonadota bacterium]